MRLCCLALLFIAACSARPVVEAGDAGAADAGLSNPCDGVTCAATAFCLEGTCVLIERPEVDAGSEADAGTAPFDAVPGCATSTERNCTDGTDDDCDGLTDCADPDCEDLACADDGKTCSRDVCLAGVCAHPAIDAGIVCRASIGGCDLAETCTGASVTCPSDTFDSTCACPQHGPIAGYSERDGLRSIPSGAFVLRDTNTWVTHAATFDALNLPKVGLDVIPLNRTATRMPNAPWPGWRGGFFWDSGDLNVAYWVPQGLAGATVGTRPFIAVGWHYEEANVSSDPNPASDGTDKGTRVSFADVTDFDTVTYRHVLFVEPEATRGFKPVTTHAGGLAWFGSMLYVADTNRGVRVFDVSRISKVSVGAGCNAIAGVSNGVACAYGYEYVIPQIGGFSFPSGLAASCKPKFSFISVDRSTTPPSLISGEYDNDPTTGIYSRLVRWPMISGGRLQTGATGIATAIGAWYAGNRNLQGATASGSTFFMNSTRNSGELVSGAVNAASHVISASRNEWGWMPEGMSISTAGNMWISTEGHPNLDRCVASVRVSDLP